MTVVPYERAGLYIPGGLAVYPSSLIMAAAPASVAGVRELVLCSPPPIPDVVLWTAKLCGVARVFRIGGAHAIAAMAYGTESVPRCEILAGPGNKFVTAAKKLVADEVAIDFLAGPTEILVLSDGETSAKFIAADLIAQSEHDPAACSILVTTSEKQAREVDAELDRQAPKHERREIIEKSLKERGALLVAENLDEAVGFSNRYAPEHLVLSCRQPHPILKQIRHAGSIFLGEYSPVAIGDYCAGPNAILPTLGDARRRSGLTANTFVKTLAYQNLSPEGLALMAPTAVALAKVENLGAHRRSIEIRHER
jgi:histidinol dehydrogenase